jgi:hypothetical protein
MESHPTLDKISYIDLDAALTECGKSHFYSGCSKMSRYKALEILRSEAYLDVRRNDEG